MRIQHNIAALNSHRQLTNNNSAVSKNLEKLSSGYRINRAGDDAAGLAISEKMRAQITGLDTASKNAQDGISLVQTAEGALTEVHSMLNRMVELADQSANGTQQDLVDRQNIQSELNSLRSEIDRISQGTNFNGIKLLDGSMGGAQIDHIAGAALVPGTVKDPATSAKIELSTDALIGAAGIADGKDFVLGDVTVTGKTGDTDDEAKAYAEISKAITANGGKVEIGGVTYSATVDAAGKKITLTSDTAGKTTLDKAAIAGGIKNDATALAEAKTVTTDGKDAVMNADTPAVAAKADIKINAQPKAGDTIEIDGTTYEYVKDAGDVKAGNTAVVLGAKSTDTAKALSDAIKANGGTATVKDSVVTVTGADENAIVINQKAQGLTLQIGDTADSFNQLSVAIKSMSSASLGIGVDDIKVSSQDEAKSAVEKIKTAINTVSSTRGDLGAIQNRLEHTINNLGVTSENMSAAESRIRDVDMAQEMMTFTKNNILTQASQAMLAQANQLPQGVLQLLQ